MQAFADDTAVYRYIINPLTLLFYFVEMAQVAALFGETFGRDGGNLIVD
jgi:hypothetical protein